MESAYYSVWCNGSAPEMLDIVILVIITLITTIIPYGRNALLGHDLLTHSDNPPSHISTYFNFQLLTLQEFTPAKFTDNTFVEKSREQFLTWLHCSTYHYWWILNFGSPLPLWLLFFLCLQPLLSVLPELLILASQLEGWDSPGSRTNKSQTCS